MKKKSRYSLCEYNHRPKSYVIFEDTGELMHPLKKMTEEMNSWGLKIMLNLMGLEIGKKIRNGTLWAGKRKCFDSYWLEERVQ